MVLQAAEIAAARLHPAGPEKIAVLIDRYLKIFTEPACGWDHAAGVYLDALADLPELLIEEAFRSVIRSHRFPTMPTPADIIAAVPESWHRWRGEHARLRGLADLIRHRAEVSAKYRERLAAENETRMAAFERNNPNVIPLPAPSGFTSLAQSLEAERQKLEAREQARARRKAIADELAARPKIALPHMPSGDEGNAETAEPGSDGAATAAEGAGGASGEG